MAIDKSVFLAGGEGPEPVWRDEAEDTASWPTGATFKLVFTRETCGEVGYDLPATEFFCADGWPVGFPARKKHLSDEIKKDFQALPSDWRSWDDAMWRRAERHPDLWRRSRAVARSARSVAALTS